MQHEGSILKTATANGSPCSSLWLGVRATAGVHSEAHTHTAASRLEPAQNRSRAAASGLPVIHVRQRQEGEVNVAVVQLDFAGLQEPGHRQRGRHNGAMRQHDALATHRQGVVWCSGQAQCMAWQAGERVPAARHGCPNCGQLLPGGLLPGCFSCTAEGRVQAPRLRSRWWGWRCEQWVQWAGARGARPVQDGCRWMLGWVHSTSRGSKWAQPGCSKGRQEEGSNRWPASQHPASPHNRPIENVGQGQEGDVHVIGPQKLAALRQIV